MNLKKSFYYIILSLFSLSAFAESKQSLLSKAFKTFEEKKTAYTNALDRNDHNIERYRTDAIEALENLFSTNNSNAVHNSTTPPEIDIYSFVNEILARKELWPAEQEIVLDTTNSNEEAALEAVRFFNDFDDSMLAD